MSLKIVSENSEEDLARNDALEKIDWALRELTANLMRVSRGAGKAAEIRRQALILLQAYEAYYTATGQHPPAKNLTAILAIDLGYEFASDLDPEDRSRIEAKQSMVCGGLQVAASRLLCQKTQESAGGDELYQGFYKLEHIREERRKKMSEAKSKAKRPIRKKAPAKRRRK